MGKYCEVCYREETLEEESNRVCWTMFMFYYICPECENRMEKEGISIMDMKSGQWASAEILAEIEEKRNERFECFEGENAKEKNDDLTGLAHWYMENCDMCEDDAVNRAYEEVEQDWENKLEEEKEIDVEED